MLPAAGVIESRSSSQDGNNPPVDRISLLPESLICHILSLLETKAAVATTRWKCVWSGEDDDPNLNFAPFVNRVLLHHEASGSFCSGGTDPIAKFAISRNVGFLIVQLNLNLGPVSDISPLEIPDALFVSGTLEDLKLNLLTQFAEFILKIPCVGCLPKLEVLNLYYLAYESNESVDKLISGCPVLQSLHIRWEDQEDPMVDFKISSSSLRDLILYIHPYPEYLTYDRRLEIDAPNLKHLVLQDYAMKEFSVTAFYRMNTATLNVWELDPDNMPYHGAISELCIARCNSVVKLVEALNSVKVLKLLGPVMLALHYATVSLSTCFERLKVDLECCSWRSLGVLLGHFIKLQVLDIEMHDCGCAINKLCWRDPNQVPECLSSTLAHISYDCLQGWEDEMAMLGYVLKHGAVLKSVNVLDASDGCFYMYRRRYQCSQNYLLIVRSNLNDS